MYTWIDDMLNAQNNTFSVGPILSPGPLSPILVKYANVTLVITSVMGVYIGS